ncbi:hypothetical protein ACEQ8H_007488 [Pleosporales sp. CAS-2024a]
MDPPGDLDPALVDGVNKPSHSGSVSTAHEGSIINNGNRTSSPPGAPGEVNQLYPSTSGIDPMNVVTDSALVNETIPPSGGPLTAPKTTNTPRTKRMGASPARSQAVGTVSQVKKVNLTAKGSYFMGFPGYAYNMPNGPPLNFTMTEILALLINWYRVYPDLLVRFINNGLSSSAHYTILKEHRKVELDAKELSRLKEGLAESYRRCMRASNHPGWTIAAHRVNENWDADTISLDGLIHVNTPDHGPVPFKDLLDDVKKLPQGYDCGDLTRALAFAITEQKKGLNGMVSDYMFPDDLHVILGQIGYTTVSNEHSDGAVSKRYKDIYRCKDYEEKSRVRNFDNQDSEHSPAKRLRTESSPVSTYEPSQQVTLSCAQALRPLPPASPSLSPAPTYKLPQQDVSPKYHSGSMPKSITSGTFASQPQVGEHFANSPPRIAPTQTTSKNLNRNTYPWLQKGGTGTHDIHITTNRNTPLSDAQPQDSDAAAQNTCKVPSSGVTLASPCVQHNQTSTPSQQVAGCLSPNQQSNPPPGTIDPCFLDPTLDHAHLLATPSQSTQNSPFSTSSNLAPGAAEIDAMLALHHVTDFPGLLDSNMSHLPPGTLAGFMAKHKTDYPPTQLLRECVEADDMEDQGAVARASRWCRDSSNCAGHYHIADLDFVLDLMGMVADAEELERRNRAGRVCG